MLIDSHCHLDFPDFQPERDAVVARARAAGLVRMITISTRIDKYDEVRALSEAYEDVFFTVGTHPHQAHLDPEASAERIVELSASVKPGSTTTTIRPLGTSRPASSAPISLQPGSAVCRW
jgi:TatD DNase family protein